MSQRNKWQKLLDYPCSMRSGDPIYVYYHKVGVYCELIALTASSKMKVDENCSQIYKYKIKDKRNKWIKVFKHPPTFLTTTFNQNKQCIYIIDRNKKLFEFNVKSKSMSKLYNKKITISSFFSSGSIPVLYDDDQPKMLSINDKIHILGGTHSIYDTKNNQFTIMNQRITGNNSRAVFHIKSRNSILVIDGSGKIFEYSLWEKKWMKWNVVVPGDDASSAVLTHDERYMVVFSGWTEGADDHVECEINKIFIYDFRMRKFMKSSIETPSENIGYRFNTSIITKNEFAEELLVFGYVNKVFKGKKFTNVQQLPFYLITLIGKWISIEYVHFLSNRSSKHWRINVDSIIGNTE